MTATQQQQITQQQERQIIREVLTSSKAPSSAREMVKEMVIASPNNITPAANTARAILRQIDKEGYIR